MELARLVVFSMCAVWLVLIFLMESVGELLNLYPKINYPTFWKMLEKIKGLLIIKKQ